MRGLIAAALIVVATPGARAARPPCPAIPAAPPAGFVAWGKATPLSLTGMPQIKPGRAYDLALTQRSAKGLTGTLSFHVDHAGTYRVALGARGWIDVKQDGKSIASVVHAHGPACSGITKIVDFPLDAGNGAIVVDELAASPVRLMVVKAK